MFRTRLLPLLLLAAFGGHAQDLVVTPTVLAFGDVLTDAPQVRTLTLNNTGPVDLPVVRARAFGEGYLLDDTALVVPAGGSASLDVTFAPRHNLTRPGELILEPAAWSRQEAVRVDLTGRGVYPDAYYGPTQDLSQEPLKAALTALIDGHTALGYSPARDEMYMVIDNWAVNGIGAAVNTLETAYTGRLVAGYSDRSDAQSSFNVNTEHTWPQSMFGSADPMQSDLFHLYVTDAGANSTRGNLPFGNVTVTPDWTDGGSKRGGGVFEPRDAQKGKTARSMLYFITRYGNLGSFFTAAQENAFRAWHGLYPPDAVEANRNADIFSVQGNRNPFIDHPEFTERIASFVGTAVAPVANTAVLAEDSVVMGLGAGTWRVWVVATGNQTVDVSAATLSGSPAIALTLPGPIAPGEAGAIVLEAPDTLVYEGTLEVAWTAEGDAAIPVRVANAAPAGLPAPAAAAWTVWADAAGRACVRWPLPVDGSLALRSAAGQLLARADVSGQTEACLDGAGAAGMVWLQHGAAARSLVLPPRR
jgi:hypothetical protein